MVLNVRTTFTIQERKKEDEMNVIKLFVLFKTKADAEFIGIWTGFNFEISVMELFLIHCCMYNICLMGFKDE